MNNKVRNYIEAARQKAEDFLLKMDTHLMTLDKEEFDFDNEKVFVETVQEDIQAMEWKVSEVVADMEDVIEEYNLEEQAAIIVEDTTGLIDSSRYDWDSLCSGLIRGYVDIEEGVQRFQDIKENLIEELNKDEEKLLALLKIKKGNK